MRKDGFDLYTPTGIYYVCSYRISLRGKTVLKGSTVTHNLISILINNSFNFPIDS